MGFTMGCNTKLLIDGLDISGELAEIDLYLEPGSAWNLVAQGMYNVGSTMQWAKAMHQSVSRRNGVAHYRVGFSLIYAGNEIHEGSADVKNFKITAGVEDIVSFKLHLGKILWKKN